MRTPADGDEGTTGRRRPRAAAPEGMRRRAALCVALGVGLPGAGCDGTRTTRIDVRVAADVVATTPDGLVVEARRLKNPEEARKVETPEEVRALAGWRPTSDWSREGKSTPGVPVKNGWALVEFSHAVGSGPRGGGHELGGVWITVWREPRDRWFPQEFTFVAEGEDAVCRRFLREKGAGRFGTTAVRPETQATGSSAERAWRVTLPLEEWTERSPR